MFTNRKYVFETRETRFRRRFRNLLLASLCFILAYSIISLILLLVSKQENQFAKETFFKKNPDLIVVFTGDAGRIPYAIALAKEMKQSNILISGVDQNNHVDILLKNINTDSQIDPNFLDLDYRPRNTYENVASTLDYLRSSKGFKDILIVSHDYHILRIKAVVNELQKSDDNFNFYYMGLTSNYSKLNNIKKLYKEVFKFFRTLIYLSLAEID